MGSFYFGGGYPGLYALDVTAIVNLFSSCLTESTLTIAVATQTVINDVVSQTVVVQAAIQTVIRTTRDYGGFDPEGFDDVDFDGWTDYSYLDAEIASCVPAQALASCIRGA